MESTLMSTQSKTGSDTNCRIAHPQSEGADWWSGEPCGWIQSEISGDHQSGLMRVTENRGQSSGCTRALGWQKRSGVSTENREPQVEVDIHPASANWRPWPWWWSYFHKVGRMEICKRSKREDTPWEPWREPPEDDVPFDGVEGILKVQLQHQVPRVQLGEVCSGSMNSTLCSQPGAVAHLKGEEQGAHFLKNRVPQALGCQPAESTSHCNGSNTPIWFVEAKKSGIVLKFKVFFTLLYYASTKPTQTVF